MQGDLLIHQGIQCISGDIAGSSQMQQRSGTFGSGRQFLGPDIPLAERQKVDVVGLEQGYESKISRLREELIKAGQHKTKLENQLDQLGIDVRKFEAGIEERDAKIEEMGEAITQLSNDIENMDSEIDDLMAKNRELMQQIDALTSKVANTEEEKNDKAQEITALSQQLADVSSNLERINGEKDRVVLELDAKNSEITRLNSEVNRLQAENAELRDQLADKEAECVELRDQLASKEVECAELGQQLERAYSGLRGEVVGETSQIVLGQLRALRELAATLPAGVSINLHVSFMSRTIADIGGLDVAIFELESWISTAPERVRQEFGELLENAWNIFAGGCLIAESEVYEELAQRFFYLGAGIDVDDSYAPRELTFDEFEQTCDRAIDGFIERLSQREDIVAMGRVFGDVGEYLEARKVKIKADIGSYLEKGRHSFRDVLNEIGKCVLEEQNQLFEKVKNTAALRVIEIIKGNSTGDDAAYIDAFVNLCGGQSAAFKRMLSVEADKIGHFVRPIAREEAIVHMRDGVAFGENVGTPEDFLSRSRLLLLRSVEGLMHDLSQFRFVYIGDGMWRDDDAVKSAFSMLNSEANGIASSFGYFEFLRRKEQFGENQGPEIVRQRNQILSIAEGNPNEDFVNFFTPDPGEGSFETLLNRLNIFMLDLYTGVTGRDYGDPEFDRIRVVLPGEEMTAYFCKVTNCVIRGDSESLEFEGARRGFLKQFILTARNALVESEGFLGDLSLEFCDRMLAISDADSFERLRVQAREDMRGYFEEITLGLSGEEQWMQDNLEIFSQAFEEASLQVFEELSRNGAYDEENLSQCKENLSQYALEAYEIRTRVHLELPPPPWNLSEFNPFAHLAYS